MNLLFRIQSVNNFKLYIETKECIHKYLILSGCSALNATRAGALNVSILKMITPVPELAEPQILTSTHLTHTTPCRC